MSDTTTWRKQLEAEIRRHPGEDLIGNTLTDEQMDVEFDDGYGTSEGVPFTAWSQNRVYFPVVYDGAEWVGSVPRNPCDEETIHLGGQ